MIELREIADANGLKLVEDACQAHGARINYQRQLAVGGNRWGGRMLQLLSRARTWAHGAKAARSPPMTTELARDGAQSARPRAAVALRPSARTATTRGSTLCRRRCCGPSSSGWETGTRAGANSRPTTASSCQQAGIEFLKEPEGMESCYHLFVIRSPKREQIRNALVEAGSNAESTIRCRFICNQRAAILATTRETSRRRGDGRHGLVLADASASDCARSPIRVPNGRAGRREGLMRC